MKGEKLTIWIDNGEQVKVVLVDESLDAVVGLVSVYESVGKVLDNLRYPQSACLLETGFQVFTDHGSDLLARVDGAVQHNGGLLALAGAAPEVDAGDGVALQRLARRHDLGVAGVLGRQVVDELQVVIVGVVRVEPRRVGRALCGGRANLVSTDTIPRSAVCHAAETDSPA